MDVQNESLGRRVLQVGLALKGCAVSAQMIHTLLPGGLLLHADAPRMFADQLLTQGTLPLMKVNMDAASTAKRLEVSADSQSWSCSVRQLLDDASACFACRPAAVLMLAISQSQFRLACYSPTHTMHAFHDTHHCLITQHLSVAVPFLWCFLPSALPRP